MEKSKLNGSVEMLAQAMRKVFSEAVEESVEPLRADMKDMRADMKDMDSRLTKGQETTNQNVQHMESRLTKGQETTNQNVQAQLAQHRRDIAADVKTAVERSLADNQ